MLPLGIKQPKKIKVTKQGVYILDEELKKEIKKKNLSPSMITSFLTSPAEWVLSTFIEPEVSIAEPIYFIRGSWYHSIMENFYKQEDKSISKLKEVLLSTTKEKDEYAALTKEKDNVNWIKKCLNGYAKLSKEIKLNEMKPALIYYNGEQRLGIELFVKEYLDDEIKLPVLGFIDCLFEGDGGLSIVDWKTGKHHPGNEGYTMQQVIYTLALEKAGFNVKDAKLIFPIGKDDGPVIENIDIHNKEIRKQVLEKIKEADKKFAETKETMFFPFIKNKNNPWQTFLTGEGSNRWLKINEEKFMQIADLIDIY